LTNGLPKISVVRKNNTWEFYVGSTLRGTGTDGTYSNSIGAYQGLFVFLPNSSVPYQHGFDNIRYREIPFGPFASAVFLGTCRQPAGSFFNTTGTGVDLIDQNNKTFTDTFFGTYIQNSGALVLKGAEVKTFKGTNANVCVPKMYYRIIPQGATPGSFSNMDLSNIIENCSVNTFPTTGGPCNPGDQKWQRNDLSIDLTALPPGNYTFQVYYEISGSTTSPTSGCGDTIILNNNGNNYNATFVIQSTPTLSSTNPTTCSGTNGVITIKGSAPNTKYAVTYKDDGVTVGPDSLTSNASGDIVIAGLNAGTYTSFSISNACTIPVNGTITLTDPSFSITPSSSPNTVCNGTGGTSTPCTYTGPAVLINEVMFMPGQNYSTSVTPSSDNLLRELQSMYDNTTKKGREWIELYNPSPCDAVDVSCYILGSQTTSTNGAAFSIPQGTVIPPLGFLVIGGGDVTGVDINLNNYIGTPNLTGGSRWFLENGCGYVLLAKSTGEVLNAVYWSQNDANDLTASTSCGSSFSRTISTPSVCSASVILPAARDIAGIEYAGNWGATAQGPNVIGKTITRSQDGGSTWGLSGVGGTIKACNGTCATPFTGGTTGGTCNGSVSVTVGGGSGTYTYEWKNSSNDVIGAAPSVTNLCAGEYTVKVTDQSTNCDSTINVTVVDNIPQVTPTFNSYGPYCQGDILPTVILPETSNNGIKGTWNPASLSTSVAGDIRYTFTPDPNQCADPVTIIVKVNPRITPTFPYGTSLTICSGEPTPNLQAISSNNVIGLWNPTNVSNTQSDVYTFTPAPGSCATTATFTVTVIQRPNVTVRPDTTIYHNAVYPGDIFSGLPTGSTVSWTNSNTSIGLPASGTGNVPAFTAINNGSSPVTATITVNSTNGNCAGTVRTYKITVLPLNRDVFVPNVFTPNGDAKNDQLFVFGNYITKLEMRIFNQWGELVKVINNPSVGWDGTHKGKPQPVGVYVYTLRATLADGTEVNKKGSITLLR